MIGKLTDPVHDLIDMFFSNSVVTASIVVGSILFASDELLRVK